MEENTNKKELEHTSKAWMGIGCFMLPIIVFFLVIIIYFTKLVIGILNPPVY
jgi:hypothetical protein